MILEFKVKNFLSFKESASIETHASNYDKTMLENIINVGDKEKNNLIKQLVIYGPNASGKSNIIEAYSLIRNIIIGKLNDTVSFKNISFASTEQNNKPTEIEIQFYTQRWNKYDYIVCIQNGIICKESLFKKEQNEFIKIIHREYDFIEKKYEIEHNKEYETNLNKFSDFSETKSSILSLLRNFKDDIFAEVVSYFLYSSIVTLDAKVCSKFNYISTFAYAGSEGFDDTRIIDKRIREIITHLDLGIENIHIKTIDNHKDIMFSYRGLERELTIKENSNGTNKLFDIAFPIVLSLDTGSPLFIDELDSNIHPLIAKRIVELFASNENKKNAQIIFTTHSPLFLDDILRRDQIWFCEKDKDAISHLYPLKSFKIRNDAIISKRYMSGSFGAIPFIPSNLTNVKNTKI